MYFFQPELRNSSENIVKKRFFFHGSPLGTDFYSSRFKVARKKKPMKTDRFPMNFIIPNLFRNMLYINVCWGIHMADNLGEFSVDIVVLTDLDKCP